MDQLREELFLKYQIVVEVITQRIKNHYTIKEDHSCYDLYNIINNKVILCLIECIIINVGK